MTPDALVEQIVREVLRRMAAASAAAPACGCRAAATAVPATAANSAAAFPASSASPAESAGQAALRTAQSLPAPPTLAATSGERVLAARVVTLGALPGDWTGLARLVVDSKAVVTPAVRDELKRRRVQLVRRDAASEDSRTAPVSAAAPPVLHVAAFECALPAAVLQRHPHACAAPANKTLLAALQSLEQASAAGRHGVLFTPHTALAVWTAHRETQLRAAAAWNATSLRAAVATLRPNLLALDPAACAGHELCELLGAYAAATVL